MPAGSGLTDAASGGTEPADDAASAEDAAAAAHLQLFAETQYMDAETQLFTASEDTQPLPQAQSSQVRVHNLGRQNSGAAMPRSDQKSTVHYCIFARSVLGD